MPRRVKIGSRASHLALIQASFVAEWLTAANDHIEVELVKVISGGDRDPHTALSKMPEVGVFTKQLEMDLLYGHIDMVVHSAKDLPSVMTRQLALAAVPRRGPVEDVLVAEAGTTLESLPEGACVGTGSPRRAAQLLYLRPDLQIKEIRGNVETRLAKLDSGQYDALVMARAGLARLDLSHRIASILDPRQFLPAGGQGFLLVQVRADDHNMLELAKTVNDAVANRCLTAERSLLAHLNAGCSAAVGCYARIENDVLTIDAIVLDKAGKKRLYAAATDVSGDGPEQLARTVADDLIEQGAEELMEP